MTFDMNIFSSQHIRECIARPNFVQSTCMAASQDSPILRVHYLYLNILAEL